jgi:hypothetical protein
MQMIGKSKTLDFSSRANWRGWLTRNHMTMKEVWLIYNKESFKGRSFAYRDFLCDAVEEAICFGWIDSRVKRIGRSKLGVRFTPRKSRGNWSKYYRIRALMLFHNGLMTKLGIDVLPADFAVMRVVRNSSRKTGLADCAAGILLERGRFLVEKRRDDEEADPGFNELPGGHVEHGERVKSALRER